MFSLWIFFFPFFSMNSDRLLLLQRRTRMHFMCCCMCTCKRAKFLVSLTLQLIFFLLGTESAQIIAGGHEWDASVHPVPTTSIFAQYSEIWRKPTCSNIYACGQKWNPDSLSKLLQYASTHVDLPTWGEKMYIKENLNISGRAEIYWY